jgi:HD superfamily phosphodiesterase
MDYEAVKIYILKRLEEGLPQILYYHGLSHTLNVLNAVEKIAEGEGVSGNDLILLSTAALFHDSGFLVQYKNKAYAK